MHRAISRECQRIFIVVRGRVLVCVNPLAVMAVSLRDLSTLLVFRRGKQTEGFGEWDDMKLSAISVLGAAPLLNWPSLPLTWTNRPLAGHVLFPLAWRAAVVSCVEILEQVASGHEWHPVWQTLGRKNYANWIWLAQRLTKSKQIHGASKPKTVLNTLVEWTILCRFYSNVIWMIMRNMIYVALELFRVEPA